MDKKQRKVVIVGDGSVGSSFAFSLVQNCALDELVIVDLVKTHAEGDVKDLKMLPPLRMRPTFIPVNMRMRMMLTSLSLRLVCLVSLVRVV